MSSPKSNFNPIVVAWRTVCASAAIVAMCSFASTSAQASTPSTNSLLQAADSLRTVYQTNKANSKNAQDRDAVNQSGAVSADCDKSKQNKIKAAGDYVKNKIPPDPSIAIQSSSCFLDVMDIAIPTSGNGFLDSVMGALSPLMKQPCQKSTDWWAANKSNMQSGQFGALGNQFSQAVAQAQVVNSNGTIQSYSNLINGVANRPADTSRVIVTGSSSVDGRVNVSANNYQTTAQSMGLGGRTQTMLDLLSNPHFSGIIFGNVDQITSDVNRLTAGQTLYSYAQNYSDGGGETLYCTAQGGASSSSTCFSAAEIANYGLSVPAYGNNGSFTLTTVSSQLNLLSQQVATLRRFLGLP